MALDPSNSSNLEQLTLKGLITGFPLSSGNSGESPEWRHLAAGQQDGPEFAADADVGECHGNERKDEDE